MIVRREIIDVSLSPYDYGVAVYYILATAEASAIALALMASVMDFESENPKDLRDL